MYINREKAAGSLIAVVIDIFISVMVLYCIVFKLSPLVCSIHNYLFEAQLI